MIGVVGTWTCFWVVLNPENRLLTVSKRRNGAVVQVQMRDLDASLGQRPCIQCKAVVLTGDLPLTGRPTGMVQTAMAIGEFERAAPESQAKDLMPKADSKKRQVWLIKERAS